MGTHISSYFTEAINLSLLNKAFYLALILALLLVFKSRLQALVGALSSIQIGGNSFNFGNKSDNSKYYSYLGDMFYELLSSGKLNENSLWTHFTDRSVSNLALFLKDYVEKIPTDEQDINMLHNGCMILVRKNRDELSKKIIEKLRIDIRGIPMSCINTD